ncbi:TonB family protein [Nisaea sp.]|uniref:energy transducer TonB n=1 Tax=Nisaea sp. TaxID=2024842 RepID=UPI0032EFB0AF
MNAILDRRGTGPSMIAGFAAALAVHGLAVLSFAAFEPPATSSADTGEGGLVVMMGDAGGITAQTVAETVSAAAASGSPDGEAVEATPEQAVAVPPPETPVTEVSDIAPAPTVPVEMVEADPVEAETVEAAEPVAEPVPQEAVVAEAVESVPVETETAAVEPPPLPVTRPTPTRAATWVKPVETKLVAAKPAEAAPPPQVSEAKTADAVSQAQTKRGSGVIDAASSAPNRAAGPGQTQASSGGGAAAGARQSYNASVLSWLERHKRYPRAARLRRYEGTVSFSFTIDRSGKILRSAIVKSSGRKVLDEALLALLKRADPLPPTPAEVPGPTFDFSTAMVYVLR